MRLLRFIHEQITETNKHNEIINDQSHADILNETERTDEIELNPSLAGSSINC